MFNVSMTIPSITLEINYALTVNDMLNSISNIAEISTHESWHTIQLSNAGGVVKVRVSIFDFGKKGVENGVLESNVRSTMHRQSFRPANFEELIAFGIQFPEEAKKKAIAALGTRIPSHNKTKSVPWIYTTSDKRLYLGGYAQGENQKWYDFRFLGAYLYS